MIEVEASMSRRRTALSRTILAWNSRFAAVGTASNSLVNNAGVLGKVYFPRLAMPVAALGAPLVDYAVASAVLFGLMGWCHVAVTASLANLDPRLEQAARGLGASVPRTLWRTSSSSSRATRTSCDPRRRPSTATGRSRD